MLTRDEKRTIETSLEVLFILLLMALIIALSSEYAREPKQREDCRPVETAAANYPDDWAWSVAGVDIDGGSAP